MQNDQREHIEPITLWQYACRGIDLSKRDHQHVIACAACETLAMEIDEALADIGKKMSHTRSNTALS